MYTISITIFYRFSVGKIADELEMDLFLPKYVVATCYYIFHCCDRDGKNPIKVMMTFH